MAIGLDSREDHFQKFRKIYWGTIYDDLEPWDADVALKKKKPLTQVRLTKLAVDTANSYLFAAGQGPTYHGEDDDSSDRIAELHDESGLGRIEHEIGRLALLNGTAAIGFHHHEGRYDVEMIEAATSTPTFGRDNRAQANALGIDYDDVLEIDEKWRSFEVDETTGEERELLHRRKWRYDETVEYHPIPAGDVTDPADMEWREDEERTHTHNLGFVPAEWIPNGRIANDIDGAPLVDSPEWTLENELNYVLSQCVRGTQYNGEPLLTFLNASDTGTSLDRGGGNTLALEGSPQGSGADAKLLELSGGGQQVQMALIDKLRQQFTDVARIVLHDPQNFGGALSGVALQRLLQPMIALINFLRPFYAERIGRLLAKMKAVETGASPEMFEPVSVQWPDIVEPTDDERARAVEAASMAVENRLLRRQDAVAAVAPLFGVEDTQGYADDIAEDEVDQGTAQFASPPGTGDTGGEGQGDDEGDGGGGLF